MEFSRIMNGNCGVSRFMVFSLLFMGIGFAQENRSEFSIARQTCSELRSPLQGLIKDGSLASRLEVGQFTWTGAWIERGPWMWHSSDRTLHPNQGCFTIQSQFYQHFMRISHNRDMHGCINYCHEYDYAFTGISMTNRNVTDCYCGNQVPLEGAVDEAYCHAECKSGESMCGSLGYARVITSAAAVTDFHWTNGTVSSSNMCAALRYVNCWYLGWGCSAVISQADCMEEKKVLCATSNTNTFSGLPWAAGHPVLRSITCIRTQETGDAVELISSDWDAECPFICISSDKLASSSDSSIDAEPVTTQYVESTTSSVIPILASRYLGISFAQENRSEFSIARQTCDNRISQLPDLTSTKDGSLLSKLKVDQTTWIGAWIERGPWMWHSSDEKLYQNQGCFMIQGSFGEHFVWKSSSDDRSGCTQQCANANFTFSGISMNNSLICYCGNKVPLQGAVDEGHCGADCGSGDFNCGNKGYARVIISKAYTSEIPWTAANSTVDLSRGCAYLHYEHQENVSSYFAVLNQTDCLIEKKALCETGGTTNVSSQPMSWFEAQNFCQELERNGVSRTARLYKRVDNVLPNTDYDDEYWTQLSLLHLSSSDSSDTFSGLQWASGHPVLKNRTCIRAVRMEDEIKLTSSDCDAESPFICVSSGALTSVTSESSITADTITTQFVESTTSSMSTPSKSSVMSMAKAGPITRQFMESTTLLTPISDKSSARTAKSSAGALAAGIICGILVVVVIVALVLGALRARKTKGNVIKNASKEETYIFLWCTLILYSNWSSQGVPDCRQPFFLENMHELSIFG
ncbi:hypothetical protein CAPTEDRAFT_197728 [Capitella teleta]|uniref:WSC domain-containing protein n=1 Tax=Capitella teleta TaxID=283909 RepID=R7U5U6_CAPTE|nr:hypothetical protein CAPTEDRAFT_197728 [Capitella teleta]|eukprot:ELT99071.1 hypothetical protein CAPTEDRAFT_197728 [Capitella teleta]